MKILGGLWWLLVAFGGLRSQVGRALRARRPVFVTRPSRLRVPAPSRCVFPPALSYSYSLSCSHPQFLKIFILGGLWWLLVAFGGLRSQVGRVLRARGRLRNAAVSAASASTVSVRVPSGAFKHLLSLLLPPPVHENFHFRWPLVASGGFWWPPVTGGAGTPCAPPRPEQYLTQHAIRNTPPRMNLLWHVHT
jgi:hypothetical protein